MVKRESKLTKITLIYNCKTVLQLLHEYDKIAMLYTKKSYIVQNKSRFFYTIKSKNKTKKFKKYTYK